MRQKIPRRQDPNCEEVRGWVSQAIARKFKALCKEQGKEYSDGLEDALSSFIKQCQEKVNE